MADALQRDKLSQFVQSFGKKRTVNILSTLGKGQAFIDAISSAPGQQILGEAQAEWSALLVKIAKQEANTEDSIKFRVLDQLLVLWASKIAKHFDYELKIENEISISQTGRR